jgi:hypothetical protein
VSRKFSLNYNSQSGQLDNDNFQGSFSLANMVRKLKLERFSRREELQQSGSHEELMRSRLFSSETDDRALFNE